MKKAVSVGAHGSKEVERGTGIPVSGRQEDHR